MAAGDVRGCPVQLGCKSCEAGCARRFPEFRRAHHRTRVDRGRRRRGSRSRQSCDTSRQKLRPGADRCLHGEETRMTTALAVESVPLTEPGVREAVSTDNAGLIDLASSCAMQGDIALRIERDPDFFALNRLEGDRCRIGVAEHDGKIVGCIAASERTVYIDGRPTKTGYVGDLKVHPAHRHREMADALCRYAQNVTRELPVGSPVLITVLSGNRSMERRLSGPRGLPRFEPVTTLRTHSVSVLWKRRLPDTPDVVVEHASWRDVDDMIGLWNRVA